MKHAHTYAKRCAYARLELQKAAKCKGLAHIVRGRLLDELVEKKLARDYCGSERDHCGFIRVLTERDASE